MLKKDESNVINIMFIMFIIQLKKWGMLYFINHR